MNALLNPGSWPTGGVAVAGMLFVQSSVVLIVVIGLVRAFRGRAPVLRSAILRAGLAAALAGPAASIAFAALGLPGLPIISWPIPDAGPARVVDSKPIPVVVTRTQELLLRQEPSSRGVIGTERPASTSGPSRTQPMPVVAAASQSPSRPVATTEQTKRGSFDRVFLGLWMALSGLLVVRLGIANARIAIIRRRTRPGPLDLRQTCHSIAGQLGVPTPKILLADGIPGPCLVGWLRPAILLPADGGQVEREILIHELAHLARRDCAWQLAARLATALLWFQPLMWMLGREMERAAEEACDDVVIALGGNRGAYVRTLAELAEKSQRRFDAAWAGLGVVGVRSAIGRRVARLLESANSIPTKLGWRAGSGIALCAAGLIAGLATLRPVSRVLADTTAPKSAAAVARHVGHVVDADGKPVPGAEILLVEDKTFQMPVLESTRSDAEGRFALSYDQKGTQDKRIEIQVYAPGRGVGSQAYDPANVGEVRLKPATRITLTITGPDGKPLADLHLYPTVFSVFRLSESQQGLSRWFMSLPPQLSQRMSQTTAADGTVTFADLPRGAKFDIGFDDDRFADLDVRDRIPLSDTDPVSTAVAIRLDPGATITGTVRFGPTGKLAAGIPVYAQGTNRSGAPGGGSATTDEKGQFRIKHVRAGEYNVMLFLHNNIEKDWTAAAHEWVKVQPGMNVTDVDFTLIKGGIITGKVIMADTGQPLTDTDIAAHGPAHPRSSASVQVSQVGPDGTYTLRVPPGAQYVYARPLPPAYRQDKQDIREVTVGDGQTVTLDFKIPRRAGVPVNGIVIGVDGKPAAGITVRALINPRGFDAFAYAESDAQGGFHFDALPPSAPLSVRDGQWGTAESVYFDQGQELRIQLVRRVKLTLPGLITDQHDKPIAGARVKLSERIAVIGTGRGDPIITGEDGRYTLPDLYTDSDYDIAADAEGFGEAQFRLSLNAKTRELPTLKLPRADATTGGRVVDEKGRPLAGIIVHLNNGMSPRTAVTDTDGRFSFKIVPGSHHLIWIAVKRPGAVGPNANGSAGRDDIRLVLPTAER